MFDPMNCTNLFPGCEIYPALSVFYLARKQGEGLSVFKRLNQELNDVAQFLLWISKLCVLHNVHFSHKHTCFLWKFSASNTLVWDHLCLRLHRIWMLHVCVLSDRRDKQSRGFICERRGYLYSQTLRTRARNGQGCRLTRAKRGARGVRSGISPHGDARRWGSENGKLGRCDEGLKKRRRKRERESWEKARLSKNKFQRHQRYNKVTWISERAEQFRVKYWHYYTRVEE